MDPVEPVETDELLWRRATAGDATGMGVLFQRHANTVYNHCFRQIGNWSTAEDLTSVAFMEAWRQRRRLRLSPTGSVPALCAWAGLGYEDASNTLAIPVGTVRSRLNGARQHLYDLLGRATTLKKEMRRPTASTRSPRRDTGSRHAIGTWSPGCSQAARASAGDSACRNSKRSAADARWSGGFLQDHPRFIRSNRNHRRVE